MTVATAVPLGRKNGAQKRSTAPRLRAASLFTGIGGFDLGFEKAGFEISFQCEIQEFCTTILEKRWPKTPRHKNIKDLRASDIPASDV